MINASIYTIWEPMATPQSLPAALDEQQDKTYDLEKHTASRDTSSTPSRCASLREQGEKTIVSFEIGDPANPYNWPQSKKLYVVITAMIMVMNSTTGSSIASGSTEATAKYFGVTSQAQLVLPVSIYLIGYVLGPLVFAVCLSESLSIVCRQLIIASHCPSRTVASH